MNLNNVGDIYNISVNNPGQEYSNFQFNIASEPVPGLSVEVIEAAVQAFADSVVASDPNFVLSSITKTEHSTNTL